MTRIPLTQGFVTLIDPADYERVVAAGPWHIFKRDSRSTLYARRTIYYPGPHYAAQFLHSFLTGWALVDHRNGDGLDNRRENLREATVGLNNANQGLRRNNTSGYKGVSFSKAHGYWRARVGDGPRRHLGYFATAEAAARAYDEAAVELFGEFARINFPGEVRS